MLAVVFVVLMWFGCGLLGWNFGCELGFELESEAFGCGVSMIGRI